MDGDLSPISAEQRDTVCQLGKGERTCSYLAHGAGGWACAKGSFIQAAIDERRAAGSMGAMGDNCEGPPTFAKRPLIVVPQFCDRHRRDLLLRRLKIGPEGPWLVNLITAQILLFTWTTASLAFNRRLGEDSSGENFSILLAEIGCLACNDHDGYLRAITLLRKGIDHAALVARHQATDPDWPIDDRIAALKNGAP